jgi:Tfp pilus assembly protein PilE
MITIRKRNDGFTIIELVIILLVIIVLAALVFKNYDSIQARSRNTARQNDLKVLQQKIESFYSNNGYFPNLTDLNSSSWRAKNMPGLDNGTLVDPLSACDPSTSACLGGSDKAMPKQYEYFATKSDGSSCDGKLGSNADQNCAQYQLIASYEGNFNGVRVDKLQNLD